MKKRIFILLSLLGLLYSFLQAKPLVPFGKYSVYILEDGAPLYEEPNQNSEMLLKLEILHSVYILGSTNLIKQNRKEEWFYINSRKAVSYDIGAPIIKGWIERKYIFGKEGFKSVKKIQEVFIMASYVEFGVVYHIMSNGTLEYKYLEGNSKVRRAKIYRFKNILSLGNKEFLYYDKDENLNARYTEIQIITNKTEIEKYVREYFGQDSDSVEINDFYILTGDNVNVRSEASTNSTVLLKLKKGARVKLLKRSEVEFTIGDKKGYWVYIETGVKDKKGKTIKGWVVDVYLR